MPLQKRQRIRKERQPKIEEIADEEETKNRTTSPLEEDKMGVFIKLPETDVCYEQLLFFFSSSSLTRNCLMLFILLILTRVYLQEYTSYQTHVQHVFASW
jgi:hypothetical protein